MTQNQCGDRRPTTAPVMTPARTGERRRVGLIAALLIGALVAPRVAAAGDASTANTGAAPAADDFASDRD